MKRVLLGISLCLAILSQTITARAANQCPKPIEVTYTEAQELMKIAYCEAGNQGIDGQRFVMSVILNRVDDPDYPDNIHDVIYQSGAFATEKMDKAELTAELHLALAEIEKGNIAPQIIAFERVENNALEKYFSPAFPYRDHVFYTKKH